MNNNRLTPKDAQQLTADLCDILKHQDPKEEFLEYIIDEYLYLIDDNKLNEIEDIIVNQFGYD